MLEAIAFQSCEVIESMEQDYESRVTKLVVDGGVVESDILMQLQADLLGLCVERPKMRESTALGAAIASGLGAGLWTRVEDAFTRSGQDSDFFQARLCQEEKSARIAVWKSAVRKSF